MTTQRALLAVLSAFGGVFSAAVLMTTYRLAVLRYFVTSTVSSQKER